MIGHYQHAINWNYSTEMPSLAPPKIGAALGTAITRAHPQSVIHTAIPAQDKPTPRHFNLVVQKHLKKHGIGPVHSTLPVMPGSRTSAALTSSSTTRTIRHARVPSADSQQSHAPFSFGELVNAYLDCRTNKRNSNSALQFELNQEAELNTLYQELISGEYQPGTSICFVITQPKPREVWAAQFRDRIVHHLLYNHIAERFHNSFIADSCACIPGRGTLYGIKRLDKKIRSITLSQCQPQSMYLKAIRVTVAGFSRLSRIRYR